MKERTKERERPTISIERNTYMTNTHQRKHDQFLNHPKKNKMVFGKKNKTMKYLYLSYYLLVTVDRTEVKKNYEDSNIVP